MIRGKVRYTARYFGSGEWRIWDRDLHQWLAEHFSNYPDQILNDLNGCAPASLSIGASSAKYPRAELRHLVCLAFIGAILGGLMAVSLFSRGQPLQGEDGCGLFVSSLILDVMFVGGVLGGLLCLSAGLLFNRVVDQRAFNSMLADFDSRWQQSPDDPTPNRV